MDNIIWFIVVGIIILMAVIGYIADKTDFGRTFKEEKIKKVKNIKKQPENKLKIEPKGINEINNEINDKKIKNADVKNETKTVDNENIDQSLFEPLVKTEESLKNDAPIVIPDDKEESEQPELKNIEPVKLEEPKAKTDNKQTVAEDEDIWKF